MDYAEHERTYSAFLQLLKWSITVIAALLIAMAAGFFGGLGLWAILLFAILMLVAYFVA